MFVFISLKSTVSLAIAFIAMNITPTFPSSTRVKKQDKILSHSFVFVNLVATEMFIWKTSNYLVMIERGEISMKVRTSSPKVVTDPNYTAFTSLYKQ